MEIAKKILKITPLFFVIAFFCFAQEGEKITISTYYPSPYGVYKHMKSETLVIGDVENPPEAGVIRFESLASSPGGEEGDLYYDSFEHKFKYYAEGSWKPLGEGEGAGTDCGWFRGSQCPVDWTQEGDPIKASDFPVTVEGYKAIVFDEPKSDSYGANRFKCLSNSKCVSEKQINLYDPAVNSSKTACKRCFGNEGFVGLEALPACKCDSFYYYHTCEHYRCRYQGDTPTPPLMAEYTLYYCCPPDE